MNEGFKCWAHDMAEIPFPSFALKESVDKYIPPLAILIKAMWAINREPRGFTILMDSIGFSVTSGDTGYELYFYYDQYNNSEQKALTAALEYIYTEDNQ